MFNINNLVEKLEGDLKGKFEAAESGQALLTGRENVVQLIKSLKEKTGFSRLGDITSVDYRDYFEVVYHLLSDEAELLAIRVKLEKNDAKIPSIISIWKAADSQEREIYDLMGIDFEGHGNLKRILCPDDFEGHPLRKDFKLDTVNRF